MFLGEGRGVTLLLKPVVIRQMAPNVGLINYCFWSSGKRTDFHHLSLSLCVVKFGTLWSCCPVKKEGLYITTTEDTFSVRGRFTTRTTEINCGWRRLTWLGKLRPMWELLIIFWVVLEKGWLSTFFPLPVKAGVFDSAVGFGVHWLWGASWAFMYSVSWCSTSYRRLNLLGYSGVRSSGFCLYYLLL